MTLPPNRPGLLALRALRESLPQRPDGAELRVLQVDRRGWTRLRLDHRLQAPAAPGGEAARLGPLHARVLVPAALRELAALSPEYLAGLLDQWEQLGALGLASDDTPAAPVKAPLKSAASAVKRKPARQATTPKVPKAPKAAR